MRNHHATIHRDCANGAHQLNGSNRNSALTDAYRNRLPGKPLLLEVTNLPLFGRHDSADFVGQIYTCFLAQSESGGVFRNAIDAKFFRQRVKEDVARLINCLGEIDLAMPGFNPTSKAAAVESSSAVAMHVKWLGDTLLPTRSRHKNFEG